MLTCCNEYCREKSKLHKVCTMVLEPYYIYSNNVLSADSRYICWFGNKCFVASMDATQVAY